MPARPKLAVGALGERLAEAHLARTGYRVLERNFRTASGELDLVVEGRGCLVFCEVRSRVAAVGPAGSGPCGALESIGPLKRRRLRRLAREWLAARQRARSRARSQRLRFDAIAVTLARDGTLVAVEHVEDAF